LLSIHRTLLSRAKATPGNKRDKEHFILDVVMQANRTGLLLAVGCCTCERLRRTKMIFDYSLAALVAAGLLLIYALLRPERF
jgi:hypothetical protein